MTELKIFTDIAPVNGNDITVIRFLKATIMRRLPKLPVLWRIIKDYSLEYDCSLIRVCALVDGNAEQQKQFLEFMVDLQVKG